MSSPEETSLVARLAVKHGMSGCQEVLRPYAPVEAYGGAVQSPGV